jgi:hypothetical protein
LGISRAHLSAIQASAPMDSGNGNGIGIDNDVDGGDSNMRGRLRTEQNVLRTRAIEQTRVHSSIPRPERDVAPNHHHHHHRHNTGALPPSPRPRKQPSCTGARRLAWQQAARQQGNRMTQGG